LIRRFRDDNGEPTTLGYGHITFPDCGFILLRGCKKKAPT
jgi:hypothetical protein